MRAQGIAKLSQCPHNTPKMFCNIHRTFGNVLSCDIFRETALILADFHDGYGLRGLVYDYKESQWLTRIDVWYFVKNINTPMCTETHLDVRYFEYIFKNTNIAMNTGTHQCIASRLPDVHGYRWSQYVVPNHGRHEALEAPK